jgi:hypothetical protein
VTDEAGLADPQPHPRLRRSKCLIGLWEHEDFLLENYLTGKQTAVPPAVLQLLNSITEYEGAAAILARNNLPTLDDLLGQLVDRDLLVEEGSDLDRREELLESVWSWGQDARYFHYSTNDV